jgi:[acyl-carrier-protein] S-malonyltransferase
MSVAVVFPGQGSQAPGWGQLWQDHAAFDVVARAEAVLGLPLAHLLLDADLVIDRTREQQLSVLLASLVAWEAYRPAVIEAYGEPLAFAGHSLGQITALLANGTLTFDDGLRLAVRRAELTQAAADAHPGRMAALLGATEEQAKAACAAASDGCWIANDNAPGQIVIAGTPDGVEQGIEGAKAAGVRKAMALKVGGAFHTPLMAEAGAGMADVIASVPLADAAVPVVSNGDATAYTDGQGWRRRLADHVMNPVRWRETQLALAGMDVTTLLEVGPGEALAGMAKRTVPDIAIRSLSAPDREVRT